jgi:hypothetical protein
LQPGRNLTIETLTQLRVACIELLHVLMMWEPFRALPDPVSEVGGRVELAVHAAAGSHGAVLPAALGGTSRAHIASPHLTTRHESIKQGDAIRDDISAMLFRALMCKTRVMHTAAQTALQQIMAVAKFPKNLIQNCLRPILQNLGNYKQLTLVLLHGLGRLLELLSDW